MMRFQCFSSCCPYSHRLQKWNNEIFSRHKRERKINHQKRKTSKQINFQEIQTIQVIKIFIKFFESKTTRSREKFQNCWFQWQLITRITIQIKALSTFVYYQNKKALDMSKDAIQQIKKIIQEANRQDPKFTQLDLSEIKIQKFTPQLNAVIEKCKNLEVLHLVQCHLKTLEGFPNLKLAAIDLSKNNIDDNGHLQVLLNSKDLSQIIMTENNISKIETVLKLKGLQKLIEIDFQGNPVSSSSQYRTTVFKEFPNIEYVDRKDKDGKQQPVEEEEFEEDEDQDEYEGDEDEEEFQQDDEDFDQDEESDDKPKRGGGRKKR